MSGARIKVLGVPVDPLDLPTALRRIDALVAGDTAGSVIAVNPEKVIKAREDAWLRRQLEAAALLLPDGIGVVWAARLLTGIRTERVAGADLMQALCAHAARVGYRVFLFGASPDVNERAADELRRRHPTLVIAGRQHGYIGNAEMPALLEAINRSGAELLFVALGSPRQEMWMSQHLPALKVKVCQGVGGTFDVIAGTVQRAPRAWQRVHLEWAYRLIREPRRLLRQKALPKFAGLVIGAWLGGRRQN